MRTRPAIWSLLDMHRVHAEVLALALSQIGRVSVYYYWEGNEDKKLSPEESKVKLAESVDQIAFRIDCLPLSPVIKAQAHRLRDRCRSVPSGETALVLRELHDNILVELESSCFLSIAHEKRSYYEQKEPPFGSEVQSKFPQAGLDIAAASRCFALDEWTACVFHLMRVLEHGLQWLASDVGLKPEQTANENWKNVIDLIEKEIRSLEQLPKTAWKVSRVKFLSEAAAQFRYFKDAWRNHVSHGRENYDSISGSSIWNHVKEFMVVLSDPNIPPAQNPQAGP